MRRYQPLCGLLLGASILALSALTSGAAPQKGATDERIARDVRSALRASGVDVGGVEVKVEQAVVTLSGEVKDAREKLWLIEAAFAVEEVQAVESALVLRSSGTPQVEEAIWLALFDDGLERYLSEVLVRDGVATVRGEAPDAATRERILASVQGVRGVDSLREELSVSPRADASPSPPPAPSAPTSPAPGEPIPEEPVPSEEPASEETPSTEAPVAPEGTVAPEAPVASEAAVPPEPPALPEMPAPPEEATMPEEPAPPEAPQVPAPLAEPPAPAAPPKPPPPPPGSSASAPPLVQQIVAGILGYAGYTVFDQIQFGLEGSDVVLRGVVTEPSKKRELEEILRAVSGVGEVRNEIRILPNSDADRKLREKLFQRIYQDALFAAFADARNPPVHILVEGGWVTLTGVVDDVMQKMSAEAMVRNVFGVTSVRNQIRVRE